MKKKLLILSFSMLVFLPFYSQTLSDSLVAHYFLDGNGNDAVGNNHGTVYGAIPTVDRNSNVNSAYLFDGIDDYINIGTYNDLSITGDITVSSWVKTPSSWPTTYHDSQIYARYSSLGYNGVNLWLDNSHLGSRAFGFIVKTGSNTWGNEFAVTVSTLQLDTWYFVTGVREGNNIKVYLNGVFEGTGVCSSSPIDYGGSPIATIGEKAAAAATWYDGVIDDVRIYNRALSTIEIQTLNTTISSVEFNKDKGNQISIYPNPSSKYLNIKNNKDFNVDRIEVFNVSGQKISSKSFKDIKNNMQIDIDDLKDGNYFLKIFDRQNDFTIAKFLKLKE